MEPTEPTATAATKTPAVPVPAGMVPLSHLSEGLVTRTFAELTNLAETLPGMTSADAKKGALIRFCIHWRQQWIKLLVLVRWAKRVGDLGSLMTALAFLESQDALFAGAADALVRTHSDMLLIREPNYDIITAVDILSLGNFHRLPTIIRKSTIPPAPLSKSQIENTLVRLQDTIRMRLLADDVVPFPFRKCMSIARGCVTFTVQHKFQVTLSLDGTIPRMPWKIVDLQILVQFVKEDYEGVIGIHDYQLNGIIASAAQSLLPPPLPEQSSSIPNSGIDLISQATTVHHPLVELHDHLDHFCAHLQMEILKTQVMHLARTRWNTHLGFEYTPTPEGTFMLKIRYWCASGALPSGTDGKVLRHYVLIHLETQWATGAKAAAGFLPATADEADKNSHAIITASNSASGAKATFTQRTLTVRAFSQLHPSGIASSDPPSMEPEVPLGNLLRVDRAMLDVETVIANAAFAQARRLVGVISDALRGRGLLFLDVVVDLGDFDSKIDPKVEVVYRAGRAVQLSADVRTGIVGVIEVGEGAGLSSLMVLRGASSVGPKRDIVTQLKQIEDQVNKDASLAHQAILDLKYATYLEELNVAATALDLAPLKQLPFDESLLKRICSPVPTHFVLLQFPEWSFCYVMIAVGSVDEMRFGSLSASAAKGGRVDPAYRAWIVVTCDGTIANATTIKANIPIRRDNVEFFLSRVDSFHSANTWETDEAEDTGMDEGPSKRRKTVSKNYAEVLGEQPEYAPFWNKMDREILDLILTYARKQLSWLNLLSQVDDMAVDYLFCFEKAQAAVRIPGERLAIVAPKISIHPFYFDIVRSIQTRAEVGKDRTATLEDLNQKYCFGSLYITLNEDELKVMGKVRLTHEILPQVETVEMDSPLAHFDRETSIITLSCSQSEDSAKEILRHWKGLAAIAEVTSQIWVRRKWFLEQGLEILSFNVGTLTMRVNGCGLLSAGPSSSCRLKLRWRRFVSATNEAMTVDLKGNGLDEFVLEFDNDVGVIDLDADEGTQQVEKNRENWIRALQQVLNECRDMVVFAKRINRISSVLKILTSLETQLNEPGNLINGVRLATVIPKSLTWVRMIVGNYAVDVYLFTNDTVAVCDSAFGCADQTIDPLLKPIPFFTQLQQGAPVQQRNTFVSSLSDYLRGQNCSPETRLKPIINGLLFTSNAQQLILTRAVTHLDIMASLEWLSAKAAVLTNTRVKEEVQQLKIIFTAPTRAAGWLVSADRNWLLSIKRHTGYRNVTGGFEVSDSDLNKFTIYLNGKVRALVPSTPNMRVVLQAFMNFAELPDIVLNDLNKLGNDLESKPLGGAVGLQARPEWCITMPPGGPSHLPAEGMTCFIVESDVGRISLVIRLRGEKDTEKLLPIRYNYKTGIINLWGPNEDLTNQLAGPLLDAGVQHWDSNVDPSQKLEKLFAVASRAKVPVEKGKLWALVSQVCRQFTQTFLPFL